MVLSRRSASSWFDGRAVHMAVAAREANGSSETRGQALCDSRHASAATGDQHSRSHAGSRPRWFVGKGCLTGHAVPIRWRMTVPVVRFTVAGREASVGLGRPYTVVYDGDCRV